MLEIAVPEMSPAWKVSSEESAVNWRASLTPIRRFWELPESYEDPVISDFDRMMLATYYDKEDSDVEEYPPSDSDSDSDGGPK
jgi:hypothetical protein